ncbi:hypothetical protein [Burkholderia phage vB_BglM_WTB]
MPWDDNDDFEPPAPVIKVGTFASDEFATKYPEQLAEYVSLRVRGHLSYRAFIATFGAAYDKNQHTPARIAALEANPSYKHAFEAGLKSITTGELWDVKKSLHRLLSIVEDPFEKGSTRLSAIKELNIMTNIVVIDENGKTRAGASLADFYKRSDELTAQTANVREAVAQRRAEIEAEKGGK